jgi:DNA segregation ATPase FtsK/SpoIIIE, S-DNA-T family
VRRLINGARADDLVLGQGLVTRQRFVVPLFWSLVGLACRGVGRWLRWAARCWSITAPPALVVVVWLTLGPTRLAFLLATVAALGAGWWFGHRPSAARVLGVLGGPWLGNWRLTITYRRLWRAGMLGAGLVVDRNGIDYLPIIKKVRSTRWTDTVTVRLLYGQTPDQFAQAGEQLRHTFGAHRCTVREVRPGWVELRFYSRDPLTRPLPAFPIPGNGNGGPPADLARLPVALTEDGTRFTLRLLGTHVLIAGASGSGKGSVLWSIVRALVPLVRDGSVELWVIDPKGGMEMILGRPLFVRYEDTDPEAMAVLLEDAVAEMDARTQRLKGITRQHVPSPTDPYVVVLVDEMASLTAYCGDKDVKRRVQLALSLLLSKGRAPGYSVIAALQDPRKDVLPFRDLFPTRIALRMSEPEQVDMVLGDSARQRGARCDQIPRAFPGVGYLVREENPAPVRARFTWVTDDDIVTMGRPVDTADAAGSPVVDLRDTVRDPVRSWSSEVTS